MPDIRTATCEDAQKLLEIYAPYVTHTLVTFEYKVPAIEEFQKRIRLTLERYPYLVAEDPNGILGYAYASPFKSRDAYNWSAETSIYIKEGCHRRGVGRALYTALEELLAKQHVCNLCACISYPHPESIAFHESFGYHTAAHFTASGYKAGKWQDMVWMEKTLCPHEVPPKPFIPFSRLEGAIMNPLKIYRRRIIPPECILLKDDVIVRADDEMIITSWNTLKPKADFDHGCSCYYLKEGLKVSKIYRADNTLLYWYCDIVNYAFDEKGNALTVTDLLADVIIYPNGEMQVTDLDELADALDRKLITTQELTACLRCLDFLLSLIYRDKFDRLQSALNNLGL